MKRVLAITLSAKAGFSTKNLPEKLNFLQFLVGFPVETLKVVLLAGFEVIPTNHEVGSSNLSKRATFYPFEKHLVTGVFCFSRHNA
jgi:hypothetical protein